MDSLTPEARLCSTTAMDELPTEATEGEITNHLVAWSQGDTQALDKIVPLAFEDLRRMARRCCGRIPCRDLQPTELIGVVYVTLLKQRNVNLERRGQFFRFAGLLMERALLDARRELGTRKRGGEVIHVPLIEAFDLAAVDDPGQAMDSFGLQDVLGTAVDVAEKIAKLAKLDRKQADTARLRYFFGLSIKETAEVLGYSITTINRSWRHAKRFLAAELGEYA